MKLKFLLKPHFELFFKSTSELKENDSYATENAYLNHFCILITNVKTKISDLVKKFGMV